MSLEIISLLPLKSQINPLDRRISSKEVRDSRILVSHGNGGFDGGDGNFDDNNREKPERPEGGKRFSWRALAPFALLSLIVACTNPEDTLNKQTPGTPTVVPVKKPPNLEFRDAILDTKPSPTPTVTR